MVVMFFLARSFFENDPLCARTASCLMLFHPMFAFIGSSVNCDSLLFLVSTLIILICIRMIKKGISFKYQVGIFIGILAGCLTKPSIAAMVPLWFIAFLLSNTREERTKRKSNLIIFSGILVIAGLISLYLGRDYLRTWMDSMKTGAAPETVSFFEYLRIVFFSHIMPWSKVGKRLLTSYWANFGWLDTEFSFLGIYFLALFAMATSGILVLVRIRNGPKLRDSIQKSLLLFSLLGTVFFFTGIVLMGFVISNQSCGTGNLQGRYLFPTLSLHLLILTTGLVNIARSHKRRRQIAFLLIGLMFLWQMASIALVLERYYL